MPGDLNNVSGEQNEEISHARLHPTVQSVVRSKFWEPVLNTESPPPLEGCGHISGILPLTIPKPHLLRCV